MGKSEQETGGSGGPSGVSNVAKATGVGAAGGVLFPYVAYKAAEKWGVPVEVSSAAIGLVFAYIGRWAAKLSPRE